MAGIIIDMKSVIAYNFTIKLHNADDMNPTALGHYLQGGEKY